MVAVEYLREVAEYHSDSVGMNWRYKMYCYLWEVNCICGSLYDGYKKDSGMWVVVPILTLPHLACWLLITFVSSKLMSHCSYGNLVQLWY